ncbi:MAG TPA: hypothetical protein VIL74_07940 [Pyrinomonadaceae bacterium]|jgi:hypothetical protein
MKRIFGSCLLLAAFSAAAFADIRLPDAPTPTPAPTPETSFETRIYITIDKDAKDARLLIPKNQLKELRAQLDALDGGANAAPLTGFARAQTIVGGLFLSLAFIGGGIWLTRAGRKSFGPNKVAAAAAVLFFTGAIAVVSYANIGPPLDARRITGKIFSDAVHRYKRASGEIRVELTDADGGIRLIVPDAPRDEKAEE